MSLTNSDVRQFSVICCYSGWIVSHSKAVEGLGTDLRSHIFRAYGRAGIHPRTNYARQRSCWWSVSYLHNITSLYVTLSKWSSGPFSDIQSPHRTLEYVCCAPQRRNSFVILAKALQAMQSNLHLGSTLVSEGLPRLNTEPKHLYIQVGTSKVARALLGLKKRSNTT